MTAGTPAANRSCRIQRTTLLNDEVGRPGRTPGGRAEFILRSDGTVGGQLSYPISPSDEVTRWLTSLLGRRQTANRLW